MWKQKWDQADGIFLSVASSSSLSPEAPHCWLQPWKKILLRNGKVALSGGFHGHTGMYRVPIQHTAPVESSTNTQTSMESPSKTKESIEFLSNTQASMESSSSSTNTDRKDRCKNSISAWEENKYQHKCRVWQRLRGEHLFQFLGFSSHLEGDIGISLKTFQSRNDPHYQGMKGGLLLQNTPPGSMAPQDKT